MPAQRWRFNIGGQEHSVEVEFSNWDGAGKAFVDGKLVDAWSGVTMFSTSTLPPRRFEVEGETALLVQKGKLRSRWELYVGGKRI